MNHTIVLGLSALSLGLGACSSVSIELNEKPAFLGAVQVKSYDGTTDDLLTAGLGRTGTMAAKMLVGFGVSPEDAIASVRQARPGTIETAAQEQYIRTGAPLPLW